MPAKRAKKKTVRKKATPRKRAKPSKRNTAKKTKKKNWLLRFVVLIFIILLAIAATYYFVSFETRAKMDRAALSTINVVRTHESTPAFISGFLDMLYDTIPTSEGLVVEGSELGRDSDIPFIAGTPNARFPMIALIQPSYINMFNERSKQSSCIVFRLDNLQPDNAKLDESILIDARFPRLNAPSMTLGDWRPYPIAPPTALIRQHGERGLKDAQLATNHAPTSEAYHIGVWSKAMRELTERYPKRFDEVWIYLGPIYSENSSKLSSGIAVPDGFYAIAFDLTDEGGLRALALNIPTDGESNNLNDYITSIEKIEKLTGLQFLPDLDYGLRDTIGRYISPSVW